MTSKARLGDLTDQVLNDEVWRPDDEADLPTHNDAIRDLVSRISYAFLDQTEMEATRAVDRVDGQLAVKLDDYTLWVWKADDSTSPDSTHISPTDVGDGNGRWAPPSGLGGGGGGGGSVDSVTASAPFTSSGGANPNISATFNTANGLVRLDSGALVPSAQSLVKSVAGHTGVVTLDHMSDLANVGTHTHAAIDSFIAQKAAASGLASLDSGSRVVQAPAAHAATHVTGGTDVIANVVSGGNAGLMSGSDKAKLDGIGAGANVTSVAGKTGVVTLAATDVSGVEQTANKGTASGYASLDGSSIVVQPAQALRESSGPTTLNIGAVGTSQALVRSGANIVGQASDAANGTASMRTLGTSSGQALPGNDPSVTNARTPTAHASTHNVGGSDALSDVASARGLRETGGPTSLTMAGVPNGQLLQRSGTTIIGVDPATLGGVTSVAGKTGAVSLDHTTDLANVGTNTHAAIDSFIASKAAASGIASLDSSSKVVQAPASHAGTHVTGGGDVIANVVASGNSGLMSGSDKAKLDGIGAGANVTSVASKTGVVSLDHTTDLANVGTNTHAQIDTFINSKATASGLASLDSNGRVVQGPSSRGGVFVSVTTAQTLGTTQPLSITDATMTGLTAGGSTTGSGVTGVVAGSFSASGAETGSSSGQAGLGANSPLTDSAFAGQRIPVRLKKVNGDDLLVADILSLPPSTDILSPVYGYLAFRSDLGSNLKWRLWFYYRRQSDGVEVAVTPTVSVVNATVFVPVVYYDADLPIASDFNVDVIAGQRAAEIAPGSITDAMHAANTITGASISTTTKPQLGGLGIGTAAGTTGTIKIATQAPAATGEIGMDANGRPQVWVNGAAESLATQAEAQAGFVGSQLDSVTAGATPTLTGNLGIHCPHYTNAHVTGNTTLASNFTCGSLRCSGTITMDNSTSLNADARSGNGAGSAQSGGGAGGTSPAQGGTGLQGAAATGFTEAAQVIGGTGTSGGASTSTTKPTVGGSGNTGASGQAGSCGAGGAGGGGNGTAGANGRTAQNAVAMTRGNNATAMAYYPEGLSPTGFTAGSGGNASSGGSGGGASGGGNGGAGALSGAGGGSIIVEAAAMSVGTGCSVTANGASGSNGTNGSAGGASAGGGGGGAGSSGAGAGSAVVQCAAISGTLTVAANGGSPGTAGTGGAAGSGGSCGAGGDAGASGSGGGGNFVRNGA